MADIIQFDSDSEPDKKIIKKLLDRIGEYRSDKEAYLAYYGDVNALDKDGYSISKEDIKEWQNELYSKLLLESKNGNIPAIKYAGFHKLKSVYPIVKELFETSFNIECIAACAEAMWAINKFHDEKRLKEIFFEKANEIEKRILIGAFRNINTKESNIFVFENCKSTNDKLRLVSLRALRHQVIISRRFPLIATLFLDKSIAKGFNFLEENNSFLKDREKYEKVLKKMQSYFKPQG